MTKEITKIDKTIAIARFDPEAQDFEDFKNKSFESVINLQTREEEQNTPESQEQQLANDNGLHYAHVPVSKENMSFETVDHFRKELENAPKPVIVHCASGKRAGAFVMMHMGREKGWTGDDAIKKAEDMGFECDQAELKEFLKGYIDNI